MSTDLLRRIALAALVALAGLMAAVPAGAVEDKPDYVTNNQGPLNARVENSVCPEFAPAQFDLKGTWHSHYKGWNLEDPPGAEEEGWTDIKASASIAGHEYGVHQRYSHPRAFRELIYGYAVTVIKRDDGATMQGDSMLWLDPELVDETFGQERITWLETPTCTPPRH